MNETIDNVCIYISSFFIRFVEDILEPRVVEGLLSGETLGWIFDKQFLNEVFTFG